ncbi:MAG TPA: trypsin-like peptidase domain-containing protein [Anaerolineales bacterium]|nr:trypsin-like peptidase domain-containing protein [Anaerolineales bacterium]
MAETHTFKDLSNGFADAVESAGPGVALVNGRRRFPASGLVISPGQVLTADHVVEREEDITVRLADGRELAASIAGRDPGSDLALLKLETEAGESIRPGEAQARVGELVLALGRPSPAGVQASLGVVSAVRGAVRVHGGRRRRWKWSMTNELFIHTDAIPYPGFSGGPLINSAGEVLGLNTSGLAHGMSLAIPIARALELAVMLAEHGSVRRGYLGIRSQNTPLDEKQQAALGREQEAGLLIVWVEEGSPAGQAGLIVGDILVGLDGEPVDDHGSLQDGLSGDLVDRAVQVDLLRGGTLTAAAVKIGAH